MRMTKALMLAGGLLLLTGPAFAVQVTATSTASTSAVATSSTGSTQRTGPGGQGMHGHHGGGDDLRAACEADDEKVCPGVKAAHGDIVKCLKANIASVSEKCRTALEKMKAGGPPPQGGNAGGGNVGGGNMTGGQPPAPPSDAATQ